MILNSKHSDNSSYKNRRFMPSKYRKKNVLYEVKPLISNDVESSDEEIVLHDVRHLNKNPEEKIGTSSLRNIKKLSYSTNNGRAVELEHSSDPFRHCEFLELKINEDDTLQSISVKYQCPISDIKRANNLISNQDFFAQTHLKIPVKKYSLLTEILPPLVENTQRTYVEECNKEVRTISIGIGSAGRSPSPQEAAAFFKRMDEDLVKIMMSTNSKKDSLEAAAVVLTSTQIQPLVKDSYNTVDCGIQWNYLLLFIIVIAVVIPIIIALYMYMRSSHDTQHVYPTDLSNGSFHTVSKLNLKAKS